MAKRIIMTDVTAGDEVVTLTEAKSLLGVTTTTDDDYISHLITASRLFIEKRTSVMLIEKAVVEYFDGFPDGYIIELGVRPVTGVGSVQYLMDGVVSNFTGFHLESAQKNVYPAKIRLSSSQDFETGFPDADFGMDNVWVSYTAGYATDERIYIKDLINATYVLMDHWYNRRSGSAIERIREIITPYLIR